jgi:CRISPR/Cas system-associated protein Csm6
MEIKSGELSLEQKFYLASQKEAIAMMSREEVQSTLIGVYRMMLLRENYYKQAIKEKWGIG